MFRLDRRCHTAWVLGALGLLACASRAARADDSVETRPPQSGASLENSTAFAKVLSQRLTASTRERLDQARRLLRNEQPSEALTILRLTLSAVEADDQVGEPDRAALAREVRAAIQSAVRTEEETELKQAERLRLAESSAQRSRGLDDQARNEDTTGALMTEFAALMAQGRHNILAHGSSSQAGSELSPFFQARDLALHARALVPERAAPRAGVLTAQMGGFLAQSLAHEDRKETLALMTLQDVERASIPFSDTSTIEFPPAESFRRLSESRTRRYESVSLVSRDPKTLAIERALAKPLSMPFANETSLEEVLKYIRGATASAELPDGIPIYVDPVGLQEEGRTMASQVTVNLEGVPLKHSLILLLKQLGLTYTVKDGFLMVTTLLSRDQPTEIRVYPVADLAIIPASLMGGGAMGRGGMGGFGAAGGGGVGMGNGMGNGMGLQR